jgi:VWFA-related protein
MRYRDLIPVFLIALTAAPPSFAQVAESMTVEVVEVPVYVTSADGTPLRGLHREQFELRVNGKTRAIDYFDSVDLGAAAGSPEPAARSSAPLRARRLYLLIFDLLFGSNKRVVRAQQAAAAMIERPENAEDLFAVAAYSPVSGLRLVTPFLHDRAVLRHAIHELHAADEKDPLGMAMPGSARNMWTQSSGADLLASVGVTGEMAGFAGGSAGIDNVLEARRRLVTNQLADFEGLAKRLRGIEGQKYVVLFSSGWDWRISIIPGNGYNEYPDLHARIADMARAFKDAGVFLYGLDTAGVRTEKRAMIDSQEGMRRVIRPTGGDLLANTNDFAHSLRELSASHDFVYILGFHRREARGGDIDVRVANLPRGAHVTFRPGFGRAGEKHEFDALQIADILLNDIPQNGVTIKSDIRDGVAGTDVVVTFSRSELASVLPAGAAADLLIYVFDEHGTVAAYQTKRLAREDVTIATQFSLPPGRYVAKILLHVVGTDIAGFERRAFAVSGDRR